MKFNYNIDTNMTIGQVLYGIIEVSIYTYDGVFPIVINYIDYNNKKVIFEIDQPCGYVVCNFNEVEDFVFESENEANDKMRSLDFGIGMCAYI